MSERPTYDEFMAEVQGKAPRTSHELTVLRRLVQAKPAAERLTGDPNWDLFTSLLQGLRDKIEARRNDSRDAFLDSRTLESSQFVRFKMQGVACQAQMQLLDEILDLPAALKRGGAEAGALVRKLEQAAARHAARDDA